MGLAFQIIGVLLVIVSLICSVISIIDGSSKTIGIVLLIGGYSLIKIGRKMYRNTKR